MKLLSVVPSIIATGLFLASATAMAGNKMDICHRTSGIHPYIVINVSVSSVAAHFANHGDGVPGNYWSDNDGDGYGDAGGLHDVCPQNGMVGNTADCNDGDAGVSPGQSEIAYNGKDDDCDAATPDDDLDSDGYGAADDCDEGNGNVNPGMTESAYNGLDDDCNAATPDDDLDSDGYRSADDCDDLELTSNPDAEDACGDGVDNNCNDVVDESCVGACPCYSEQDIHAATANQTNVYEYCEEVAGQTCDAVFLQAYSESFDGAWTSGNQIFTTGVDEYTGEYYCASISTTIALIPGGDEYEEISVETYLTITSDEQQSCQGAVVAGATTSELTCEAY